LATNLATNTILDQILQDHNQNETLGEMKMDSLGATMVNNDPNGATVALKQVKNGQTEDKISPMTGEGQNRSILLGQIK